MHGDNHKLSGGFAHFLLRPFHTTVECTSKPDQTISHLSRIDRNAHSIRFHVNPLREVNWPDLMRISSISKKRRTVS